MGFKQYFFNQNKQPANEQTESPATVTKHDDLEKEVEASMDAALQDRAKKDEKRKKLISTPIENVDNHIVEMHNFRYPFLYKGQKLFYDKVAYYLLLSPVSTIRNNTSTTALQLSGLHFGEPTTVSKIMTSSNTDEIFTYDDCKCRFTMGMETLDNVYGISSNDFLAFAKANNIHTIADLCRYAEDTNSKNRQSVIDSYNRAGIQQENVNDLF